MIQPVSASVPKVFFKGSNGQSKKASDRSYEKRLAIINATGMSLAMGALTSIVARGYTNNWKNAGLLGLGGTLITMMFICPRQLYKAGFYTTAHKEKESDLIAKTIRKAKI